LAVSLRCPRRPSAPSNCRTSEFSRLLIVSVIATIEIQFLAERTQHRIGVSLADRATVISDVATTANSGSGEFDTGPRSPKIQTRALFGHGLPIEFMGHR
jgi:hypothetical protein